MNSPPVKPRVRYEHGLLTIDAPNCTLADVLNGVAAATGATFEGASPSERVAVRLGPGDARAILAALLRGTPYNYILLGSQRDPRAVTRILLTRSNQAANSAAPQIPRMAPPPAAEASPDAASGEESPFLHSHDLPDEQPAPDSPEANSEEPQTAPRQTQQPAQQPKNQPTTPEELFRQLQHPFQQQQGSQ